MKMRLITLALILGTVLLCACSDDDVVAPPDDGPVLTPGIPGEEYLMNAFRTAYENMDSDALTSLMHPDFVTILQPATTLEFPTVGPELDFEEELQIAERMLSGQAVTNANGEPIVGVTSIDFNIFEQQQTWSDTGPTDPIPNALTATYDVLFVFERAGGATLPVEGQIKFFLSETDTVINGVNQRILTMIGQQDLTNSGKKGIEKASWGSIKALYW